MRVPKLWFYFAVHAVTLVITCCVGFFLLDFLVVPELVWLRTGHLQWMPFNVWMSRTLGGIPIGITMAGMLTLIEWWYRTDEPIIKKIIIAIVTTTIIMSSMYQVVLWINILLPH